MVVMGKLIGKETRGEWRHWNYIGGTSNRQQVACILLVGLSVYLWSDWV